jgi:hypothetical protein
MIFVLNRKHLNPAYKKLPIEQVSFEHFTEASMSAQQYASAHLVVYVDADRAAVLKNRGGEPRTMSVSDAADIVHGSMFLQAGVSAEARDGR